MCFFISLQPKDKYFELSETYGLEKFNIEHFWNIQELSS